MEFEIPIIMVIAIIWTFLWLVLIWRLEQVSEYNKYLLSKACDKDVFNQILKNKNTDYLNEVPKLIRNWRAVFYFWTPLEKYVDSQLLLDIHNFD